MSPKGPKKGPEALQEALLEKSTKNMKKSKKEPPEGGQKAIKPDLAGERKAQIKENKIKAFEQHVKKYEQDE